MAVGEHNLPLHKSLAAMGPRLQISELNAMTATLQAASRTGGSISHVLMNQAQALRDSIKSRDLSRANALRAFRWF